MKQIRASFAEKDKYRRLISAAYAEGLLDGDELELRQGLVEEAETFADLDAIVADLPRPEAPPGPVKKNWTRRALLTTVVVGSGVAAGAVLLAICARGPPRRE